MTLREHLAASGSPWIVEGRSYPNTDPIDHAYISNVAFKRDQLQQRISTLDLRLLTEETRPKPNPVEIAKLKQELKVAKAAMEKYDRERPR